MKTLLAVVAAVLLGACARQAVPPVAAPTNPSTFAPGTDPIPPRASLERFYQVNRFVDSTTSDSVSEVVVQANFRSQRVWCSNLGGPPTRLSLSLAKHANPGGSTSAMLGVEYEASEGLLVNGEGSLQVRLDGSVLQPPPSGATASADERTRSETMQYAISLEELQRIVGADTASVHLVGRAGRCDSPLTGHARGLIALFIERELGAIAITAKR